jgi:hypothetical protein
MSYNIIKTDGTPLATVADGQTNSTASSLTLIGKNYAGYGTFLNENFIRLLENFANSSAPSNPLVGQLWWKSDTRLLQVYDRFGTWKTISGAQSSSDAPSNAIAGDLWFDTVNQQLKVYSGASWIIIGPSFTATTGTSGAIADTIVDTSLISHVVVKFFVQNQLLGILSKDAVFTPNSTLPGFATVKPGFNLATDRIPALTFNENANNAAYLGGIIASSYLTKTTPVIEAQLEIQNPDGLIIQETAGTVDYFEINVAGNNVNLASLLRGNGLIIKTKPDNAGGLSINAITIDRTTGLVSVSADPTAVLGIATKGYVDTNDTAIKGFIAANVNTLNTTINTLSANTALVYSNVRVIQSELGIVGGPLSGFANTTPWTQITGPSGSGGASQTIAANIVALWSNVAAIHSNVLSATGIAPAATASMYSNVRALQNGLSSLGTSAVLRDGTRSMQGTLLPDTTLSYDWGSSSFRFRDFFGRTVDMNTSVKTPLLTTGAVGTSGSVEGTWTLTAGSKWQATYADLAERFAADAEYVEGTVVRIGGDQEVTQELEQSSTQVLGVVSKNYAYLMNQAAGEDNTHPAIAMTGRVPVRVIGKGTKGDRLVSAGNGCARVAHIDECNAFNVIGRLLVNKDTDNEELVMSVVSVSR